MSFSDQFGNGNGKDSNGRERSLVPYSAPIDVTPQLGTREADGLLEYGQIFWRWKYFILAAVSIGTMTGFTIALYQPIIYSAQATVEIQSFNENFMNMAQFDPQAGSLSPTEANIQTQIQILRSSSLRREVSQRMLRETVPALPPEPEGLIFKVRRLLTPVSLDPLAAIQFGIQTASGSLSAQVIKGTRVIQVGAQSTHPELAANFVNSLVKEYIDQSSTSHSKNLQTTSQWMTGQLEEVRERIKQTEEQLQKHGRGPSTAAGQQQAILALSRAQQLEREIALLQSERITRQTLYESASAASAEAFAATPEGASLRLAIRKLADMKSQLAEMSKTMLPTHARIKALESQVADLEAEIQQERNLLVIRLRKDYEEMQRREKTASSMYEKERKLALLGDENVQIATLKAQLDNDRRVYYGMIQQINQVDAGTSAPTRRFRVIDPAEPSLRPENVRMWVMNTALGAVSGLVFSVVFSTLWQKARRKVKLPGDSNALLRTMELGVIPSSSQPQSGQLQWLPWHIRRRGGDGDYSEVCAETWQSKPSPLAESFRATLASLFHPSRSEPEPRLFVVTSPGAKEGKSTVASNLAIALTEINRRILLVDGDLRGPRLHEVFNIPNSWGLSDIVQDRAPIDQYPAEALVKETEIPGLFFLPSGTATLSANRILYSLRLQTLLARLRGEFDHVVIDSPPMLQFADARILGRLSDGVILVTRAGVTDHSSLTEARNKLDADGIVLLGSILNDWVPSRKQAAYYHKHYGS